MSYLSEFANKPFTLSLSSGFFGFYAHVGFIKALEDLQLKPNAYTGTSAGAIVAAAAARGLSAKEIEKLIVGVSRKDFWDPSLGLGLLRGEKFRQLIEKELGANFSQMQAPLRIPAFDILGRKMRVFKEGELACAIQATCAVPVMFQPVQIAGRLYWDGGILDKMGLHEIDPCEKILCHYLENKSRDLFSVYELKRDQKTLRDRGRNLRQVRLKNLPQAHPFAMEHGAEIIAAAHKQALDILQSTQAL